MMPIRGWSNAFPPTIRENCRKNPRLGEGEILETRCAVKRLSQKQNIAFGGMVVASFSNVLGRAAAGAHSGVGPRRKLKQGAA